MAERWLATGVSYKGAGNVIIYQKVDLGKQLSSKLLQRVGYIPCRYAEKRQGSSRTPVPMP
jgi:hypothetical protein